MTRTSNPCAVVLAFAYCRFGNRDANTITFSGEVTDQTFQVAVNGFTDPTVILDSVPVSASMEQWSQRRRNRLHPAPT